MMYVETGTVLDRILARTAADLEQRRLAQPLSELEGAASRRSDPVSLRESLAQPGMSVIAEIKRASPSRGLFPVEVDPASVAKEYIAGGAAAISVLTDGPFFQGSLDDLAVASGVAHAVSPPVPILRKDFVIDRYQIVEARAHGADAILLIAAALNDATFRDLFAAAAAWGLDALVEIHDEEEMKRAVDIGATFIGINNRDLRDFSVDLRITERLAPLASKHAVVVAESGVLGIVEIERLARAGANAVLVGEGLITATDREAAVKALRNGAR